MWLIKHEPAGSLRYVNMQTFFTCIQTVGSRSDVRNEHAIPPTIHLTLAAGALTAVDDRQDDRLALPALTLQAEETHWVVRVQTVTAALTH